MNIQAMINGSPVTIVQIQRTGSQLHIVYSPITSAGVANGLVSTILSTSALSDPNIVISTSATIIS